ncbi:3-oxoacyl-ACP synthase [Mucilaginibacter calamicampi]|uniref:3-oxoacyl-ACP synthase n=1 Tax=Mucilaginibacter calamicampi TaxID=1302352 RepID=A0ABW2Z436_9SPHI
MIDIKQKLYQACLAYVQRSIDAAQQAINEAQQAAKDDTKSSAGDKYETGREMAQQESNRNIAQVHEANKLKIQLSQVPVNASKVVENGSVVITDAGSFYMAVSAGTLLIEGINYFAISLASPIGQKMKGLKQDDAFSLNGKNYTIKQVI